MGNEGNKLQAKLTAIEKVAKRQYNCDSNNGKIEQQLSAHTVIFCC